VDVINLHPAKWGSFDGIDAIGRAHKAFMCGEIDETGVMIHYVIVEVDRGEPLVQEAVPLKHPDDDKVEDLEEKIHGVEHRLIVKGTKMALSRIIDKSKSAN
jgi:phosphoribosylglycinamide formyltransferase